MIKQALFDSDQVRAIDRAAIAAGTPGIVLMKRAARAAFEQCVTLWPKHTDYRVLCGAGNNGGDGWAFAALSLEAGLRATVYCTVAPYELKGEAKLAAEYALREGVPYVLIEDASLLDTTETTVLVDALLGIGLDRPVGGVYASAIEWINQQATPVFALDIPSGLSADTGCVSTCAVRADATMSFIAYKRGLFTASAMDYCGRRFLDDLGVEDSVIESNGSRVSLLSPQDLLAALIRPRQSHKGRSGHVAICGGNRGMSGAALLSSEAAICSGAGLVSLYSCASTAAAAMTRLPEVMTREVAAQTDIKSALRRASVICLGPGLGRDEWAETLLASALATDKPKVIDADALNLIAESDAHMSLGGAHVLTPHPGEAARLLNCSTAEVEADRFAAVIELQSRYDGVVVLKGAGTLVASAEGVTVCDCGNPGMSVGGMGDVLAGVIAALVAQGLNPLEAAELGVWAHSKAADDLVSRQGEIGLKASELIPEIRRILNGINV